MFEKVLVEANEHYQKGSYRNRCHFPGPNGTERLSVPLVKGKHEQMPIREVQISYAQPWYAQHWHAIQTAYGSAPYFIHYSDQIRDILYSRPQLLFELNVRFLDFLLKAFGLHSYALSSTYTRVFPGVDLRNHIHPKRPESDTNFTPSSYLQVFADRGDFQANMSALDLLMCCGPSGLDVLRASIPAANS